MKTFGKSYNPLGQVRAFSSTLFLWSVLLGGCDSELEVLDHQKPPILETRTVLAFEISYGDTSAVAIAEVDALPAYSILARPITTPDGDVVAVFTGPTFTPDGTRVLVGNDYRPHTPRLYDLATHTWTELDGIPTGIHGGRVFWSRDGRGFIYDDIDGFAGRLNTIWYSLDSQSTVLLREWKAPLAILEGDSVLVADVADPQSPEILSIAGFDSRTLSDQLFPSSHPITGNGLVYSNRVIHLPDEAALIVGLEEQKPSGRWQYVVKVGLDRGLFEELTGATERGESPGFADDVWIYYHSRLDRIPQSGVWRTDLRRLHRLTGDIEVLLHPDDIPGAVGLLNVHGHSTHVD